MSGLQTNTTAQLTGVLNPWGPWLRVTGTGEN
jgi:hypothetical protein